jgi:membrane protease YdiL (CAAX protease family)
VIWKQDFCDIFTKALFLCRIVRSVKAHTDTREENGEVEDFGWEQQRQARRIDRKHFSRIAVGFVLYDILGAGLQFLAVVLLRQSGWDYGPYRISLSWILNFSCMYVIAMPLAAFYFKAVPKFGQVRNERWEFRAWLVVFFIGLSIGYFGNIIGTIVTNFTSSASIDYENMMDMILEGNTFLIFLNVVVGAPVVEELLFRKFLIDRTIGYGEKLSVFLSGTLFGIMHGNFQQFFYAFGLGCLFAYIYCKTGKIQNTIFFHMWINFCGSILVPFLMKVVFSGLDSDFYDYEILQNLLSNPFAVLAVLCLLGYVVFQLLSAIAGLILFFVFKHYICFYPGIRTAPRGELLRSVILNPGMVIFLGFGIYQFFL